MSQVASVCGVQERSRVALVVGSRYGAPGQKELEFAEEAAARLARVLALPSNGWRLCGGGALLNPTVAELKAAVTEAIDDANSSCAQLLISFVGHGLSTAELEPEGESYPEFYLQVRDSNVAPLPDEDFNVGSVLRSRLRTRRSVDGVIVVIDACHAGALPAEALTNWRKVTRGRLEVLVASEHDRSAYGGCFTATLANSLENGLRECGDYLHPAHMVSPINVACGDQRASHSGFTSGNFNARGRFDEGLTFGVNPQRDPHALFNRADAGVIDQVTRDVALSYAERELRVGILDAAGSRLRWITGPPGAGKSTVAAGLISPRSLDTARRDSTVNAAAFLDATSSVDAVSRELAQQLSITLGDRFRELHEESVMAATEQPGEDTLDSELLVPLRGLIEQVEPIEIVLDGFDQVDHRHSAAIVGLIHALITDPQIPRTRLIVTSRNPAPDGLNPDARLTLAGPTWAEVRRYVTRPVIREILPDSDDLAPGGWLLGRIAAALTTPPADATFASIVTTYLREMLDSLPEETRDLARLMLSLLTVTATGPALPIVVLKEALASLDRSTGIPQLRDILVALYPLVQRGKPGFVDEHVGLAHEEIKTTFAQVLLDPS